MTTTDEPTPLERLQATRQECDQGIANADAFINDQDAAYPSINDRDRERFQASYRNRKLWWETTRDAVDRAIAALEGRTTP